MMASEPLIDPDDRQRKSIYRMLFDAAEAGRPCPSNAEIAAAAGLGNSRSFGTHALHKLEKMGLIRVHSSAKVRIVTIVETGKSTADPTICPSPRPMRNSASRMRIDVLPAGAFFAVDRDPCPRCGTRRDLGCRHTASALRTRFSQEHVHG